MTYFFLSETGKRISDNARISYQWNPQTPLQVGRRTFKLECNWCRRFYFDDGKVWNRIFAKEIVNEILKITVPQYSITSQDQSQKVTKKKVGKIINKRSKILFIKIFLVVRHCSSFYLNKRLKCFCSSILFQQLDAMDAFLEEMGQGHCCFSTKKVKPHLLKVYDSLQVQMVL